MSMTRILCPVCGFPQAFCACGKHGSPGERALPESPGPAPVVGSGGVVGPLAARHWKAPFRYDAEGAMIWDANNKRALDVRGWGYLTGKGALGLPADEAEKITADFGQSVVQILNAQWPNHTIGHAQK